MVMCVLILRSAMDVHGAVHSLLKIKMRLTQIGSLLIKDEH